MIKPQPNNTRDPSKPGSVESSKADVRPAMEDLPRNGEASGRSTAASTIAKWLIPSVTALFALVGYIVQSAQQDLLGLHYEDREASTLFVSAGDFFRDALAIPTTAAIRLVTGDGVSLGGHGVELWLATLIVGAALGLPRLPQGRYLKGTWLAAGVLALLFIGKFVLVDEPLFQVRNIILGVAVEPPLGDDLGRTLIERLADNPEAQSAQSDPEDSQRQSRAEAVVASIVCSRISLDTARRDPGLEVHDLCRKEQSQYQQELRGRFVAQLWAAALMLTLSVKILRSRSSSHLQIVLAILALAYSLIVPYAYGKLQKSTYFDFGRVRVAETFGAWEGESKVDSLQALTLSRTATGTILLVAVSGPCGSDDRANYSQVTLSAISPSQVLAVERIYRQDVIAWAVRNERRCPALPGPI